MLIYTHRFTSNARLSSARSVSPLYTTPTYIYTAEKNVNMRTHVAKYTGMSVQPRVSHFLKPLFWNFSRSYYLSHARPRLSMYTRTLHHPYSSWFPTMHNADTLENNLKYKNRDLAVQLKKFTLLLYFASMFSSGGNYKIFAWRLGCIRWNCWALSERNHASRGIITIDRKNAVKVERKQHW